MDNGRGELFNFKDEGTLKEALQKNSDLTPIDGKDMTEKQKEKMQVSIHDNRSKLGVKFTDVRKAERKRVFGK